MPHQVPQLSTGKRIAVVGAFALLSAISLTWFVASAVRVWNQTNSAATYITFERGALYLFGVGLALAVLTYGITYQGVLRRPLTKTATKLFNVLLMGSLLLTFAVPPVGEYVVSETLEARGYRVCDLKSRQWPIFRDVVYVASLEVCDNLRAK